MSIFNKKQKATPSTECLFPKCEQCEHYVTLDEKSFCNVPMVISKQEMILTKSLMVGMQKKIADLEEVVYKDI